MFKYGSFLWVSLRSFLISIFCWFIAKCIQRLRVVVGCKNQGNDANFNVNHSKGDDQELVSMIPREFEPEEKNSSEFSFSFLYQESKKDSLFGNFAETDDSAFVQGGFYGANASTRRYQFVSGKNVSEFLQKAEATSFTVREMFVGGSADDQNLDLGALSNEKVKELELEKEEEGNNSEEKVAEFDSEDCSIGLIEELILEEEEEEEGTNSEEKVAEFDSADCSIGLVQELRLEGGEEGNNSDEKVAEFDSEDFSIGLIQELNLEEEESLRMSNSIEENKCVSGEDINGFEEDDDDISYDLQLFPRNEFPESSREFQPENYSDELPDEILSPEAIVIEDTPEDTEYIELEPDIKNPESDFVEKSENSSLEREFWESKNSVGYEKEDEDEFDILLEHQQLIKQMKMEMKNSSKKSLPTIAEEAEEEYEEEEEECENPKIVADLKPLKIEENKFEFKDFMEEIHKFYKSYAEKMRKLDILNYQSLHAINIVQLKDSRVFVLGKKASFPFIKHFGIVGKQRKVFADPSLKSITDMQRDLEMVYIGQVCLSWEILRWQHGKLKLLLEHEFEYNSVAHRSYNVVAGEHQQLQVLMHRFLEDEPIQGPRIKHYVENRCLCRSLLQIPIIKDDDCSKKDRLVVGEKDAIPITKLAETIKDSMQVFSEFIRSDKDGSNSAFKGSQLVNPSDLELLSNIKTCLKKKERKLKDIQRSGNCIVKKFQRHNNEETAGGMSSDSGSSSAAAVFISQVELKLVTRVLNMSRLTTEQLEWCLKKLNNINIVNRNVHVEPSFLLFPC